MSTAQNSELYFSDPLGGVPEADWDELAGERFYSSALWLRLCALASGGTSGAVHTPLPGGGRAAVPVAAINDETNPNGRWDERLARCGLPSPSPRGILVGQRRGYLAHLLHTPGSDPAQAASSLLAAVRAVRLPQQDDPRAAAGDPPACMAMYLTTPDVLALRAAGVQTMPVALATDAWIEIPPEGWEAWMHSLGSPHRVSRLRRDIRKFERAGYKVEHRTLDETYADVARLLSFTVRRHGRTADEAAMARSFRQQGELAGPRAEVLLCSKDGRPPVGFCLFYRHGDTVFLRAVGFDYDNLNSGAEYFNLTFYIPAALPGVKYLHAGTTSAEAKALRGAELRPLWLLDLSQDSVLVGRDSDIRRYNKKFTAELRDSSPVVAQALDDAAWDPFC